MRAVPEILLWFCENEFCQFPSQAIGYDPVQCIQCRHWMTPASYHRHDLHVAAIEAARTEARREGEKRGCENALSYLRDWEPVTRAIEPNERELIDEAVADTAHYFGGETGRRRMTAIKPRNPVTPPAYMYCEGCGYAVRQCYAINQGWCCSEGHINLYKPQQERTK